MRNKLYWLTILVLLLGLLAACGSKNEEPTAEPTTNTAAQPVENTAEQPAAAEPTAEPTAAEEPTSQPTEAPAPTEVPMVEPTAVEAPPADNLETLDFSTLTDESQFSSFNYVFAFSTTTTNDAGEETTQTVTADIKLVKEPPASSFVMSMDGFDAETGGIGEISMTQIGDTSYTIIPGMGCIPSPVTADDPFADMTSTFSPNSMLNDMDVSQVKRVQPNETINGIEVRHYTFDQNLLNMTADPGQKVDFADGHLYIAENGGYLVKMVMDMQGSGFSVFGESNTDTNETVHFEYTLVSVNEPLDITLPAECDASASGSDYPMLEDASDVSSFAGIVSYHSDATLEDAVSFYETELAALGYTKDENGSFVVSGSAILVFAQEGADTINLIINTDDAGGISVTITAGQ